MLRPATEPGEDRNIKDSNRTETEGNALRPATKPGEDRNTRLTDIGIVNSQTPRPGEDRNLPAQGDDAGDTRNERSWIAAGWAGGSQESVDSSGSSGHQAERGTEHGWYATRANTYEINSQHNCRSATILIM